ncbi:MAG TPA: hypothetical protein P5080_05150 [Candidatus Paceibacterota bacterium]|nr:hypothetical protein [Candidatus Pacearchaeota archaeon]HRZ51334.1 hypothetical protein [Candidatus Paceibacterota bacterium]HSA37056.1 hypothetical protein [Candidatus Paceibacterota bacterium]
MFDGLFDLGLNLDKNGLFPGLTGEQKNEWRKSAIEEYIKGPGIYLIAYVFVAVFVFFTKPADLHAFKSAAFLIIVGLMILFSAYFTRRDVLKRRELVLMASAIKWIRE